MQGFYKLKTLRYESGTLTLDIERKIEVWDVQDILDVHKSRSKEWSKLAHKDPRSFTYKFVYSFNPSLSETLQFIYFPGTH